MKRERSAGTVIFRKEDNEPYFLLLWYPAGHWDFPKGNIEPGEKEIETIKREVYEETGITDLEFIFGFRETIRYYYFRGKEKIYKEVVFYLAKTNQKEVRLSYEHKGYEWLPFEKALQRLTYENAKDVLRKAYNYLKSIGEI